MQKLLCLALFVLCALAGFAQGPASVSVLELNDDSLPVLGAQITWAPVAGATYSVYRYANNGYETCLATHNWIEITTSDLSVTTYSDFPAADAYGFGGDWCYGVTAIVNGVESAVVPAPKPMVLGLGFYFNISYLSGTDCYTHVNYPGQPGANGAMTDTPGTFVLTLVRNGVAESIPVANVNTLTSPPLRWAGHLRVLTSDYVEGAYTTPSGKTYVFPNLFGGPSADGTPVNANWGPYVGLQINSATGGLCGESHYGYFQPASNN